MPVDEACRDNRIQVIKSIAASILEASPSQISFCQRPPLDIQSNNLYQAVYRSQHIVLKEFLKSEEFDESPLREFQALQLLAPLDIAPQPRAYFPQQAENNPFVVYDFMEGEMWDRRKPTGEELMQLAYIWLQANDSDHEQLWLSRGQSRSTPAIWQGILRSFQDYVNWTENHYVAAQKTALLCLDLAVERLEAVEKLESLQPVLCFCKSDPRFANVISRPGGTLGMVDWEDSGLQDPALDLADVMSHPNQEDLLSFEEWQPFLSTYLQYRRSVDDTLEERFELYSSLLPVWWLSILFNEGMRRHAADQLSTWQIHHMDPNLKLRRCLARALSGSVHHPAIWHDAAAGARFFPQ